MLRKAYRLWRHITGTYKTLLQFAHGDSGERRFLAGSQQPYGRSRLPRLPNQNKAKHATGDRAGHTCEASRSFGITTKYILTHLFCSFHSIIARVLQTWCLHIWLGLFCWCNMLSHHSNFHSFSQHPYLTSTRPQRSWSAPNRCKVAFMQTVYSNEPGRYTALPSLEKTNITIPPE